jgi:hypothetical protein
MPNILTMEKWQCPMCRAWNSLSGSICDHCGYTVPIDEVPEVVR